LVSRGGSGGRSSSRRASLDPLLQSGSVAVVVAGTSGGRMAGSREGRSVLLRCAAGLLVS